MSVISGWVSYKTGPRREALQRDISECLDLKVRNRYLAIQSTICSYPYFIVSCPEFRFSKIEGPPSANFALQPTNSLKKPNHHLTDL